jgi:hypothetical protein
MQRYQTMSPNSEIFACDCWNVCFISQRLAVLEWYLIANRNTIFEPTVPNRICTGLHAEHYPEFILLLFTITKSLNILLLQQSINHTVLQTLNVQTCNLLDRASPRRVHISTLMCLCKTMIFHLPSYLYQILDGFNGVRCILTRSKYCANKMHHVS